MPGGPPPPTRRSPPRTPDAARGTAPLPPSGPPAVNPGGHGANLETITVDRFKQDSPAEQTTVLDVGERDAFRRGHWPGAVNIPADELPVRGGIELPRSRDVAIDCTREGLWKCRAAGSMLEEHGFTRIVLIVR